MNGGAGGRPRSHHRGPGDCDGGMDFKCGGKALENFKQGREMT